MPYVLHHPRSTWLQSFFMWFGKSELLREPNIPSDSLFPSDVRCAWTDFVVPQRNLGSPCTYSNDWH
jgi:hypothetical protein